MATRQYIGARYVPKFYKNSVDDSSAWESNVVYEPLTYVTLTNGHMYISKKQVPATVGSPASNAEYWLDIGSYNGFIEDLQNQINALVPAVNANTENLLKTKKITAARKFIILGDSYGAGWTPDGDVTGWCEHLINYLDIPSNNYTVYNLGGVGFVNTVSGQNFITMIQNVSTTIDVNEVTDIVVAGGYNDIGSSVPDIKAGISSFKTAALTRFPNARLHIAFIGYSKTRSKYEIATKRNAYIEACDLNGIEYLHNTEYALYNIFNYFASDGYHPNAAGQVSIAKAIAQALITGSADIIHLYYGLELTGKNGFSINHAASTIASDYKNGTQTLYNRSSLSISTNAYNYGLCNGTNFVAVGDITNGLFLGSTFGTPSFTVPCVCQVDSSHYREMNAIISFNQGEMRIALKSLNDTKNNWYNLTELYSIMLTNFQFTFDSDMI